MDTDIELLEAMFPGEVSVEDGIVRIPVAPQVGGNDKAQFIMATLVWNTATKRLSFDRCLGLSEEQSRRLCDQVDTSHGLFETVQEVTTRITALNEQLIEDCPICLTSLTSGGLFRLRGCFHTVHHECARDWWQSSGTRVCVVCRQTAEDSDIHELIGEILDTIEIADDRDEGPKGLLLRTENNTDFSADFRTIREEIPDLVHASYYSRPVHKATLTLANSKQALDWVVANNNSLLSNGEKLIVALNFDE